MGGVVSGWSRVAQRADESLQGARLSQHVLYFVPNALTQFFSQKYTVNFNFGVVISVLDAESTALARIG